VSPRKAFLVRWRRDFCYQRTDWSGSERLPGRREMKLFTTAAEAEAYCDGLQQGRIAAPPEANPFLHLADGAPLDSLTEMPEAVFLDLIRDLGVEPPAVTEIKPRYGKPVQGRDWCNWWRENAARLDDAQRCRIWRALDNLWFYEVVEIELDAEWDAGM
jgi:hypothetical protein